MSERDIGWTKKQVIRLVNEYKMKPILWDPNHDLFRNQTTTYEAWCELADIFGCEVPDLRKKFNSILASHRREKAKIRMGGISTWFLYHHLNFLPNHIEQDESAVAESTDSKQHKQETFIEVPVEEADPSSEEYENHEHMESTPSPVHIIVKEEPEIKTPPKLKYFHPKPNLTRLVKRKVVKENNQTDRNKILERKFFKKSHMCKKKDEYDSFGEYIAISLRKHDDRTRSMIKQAINNILFEQEMKKYNNSGQYVLGMEDNPLIVPDDCDK